MEEKPHRCKEYVQNKVFAIDFDEKSVRVGRCLNLIAAGDSQANVLHMNTLDWSEWDETIKQEEWMDTYHGGWIKWNNDSKAGPLCPTVEDFNIFFRNPAPPFKRHQR